MITIDTDAPYWPLLALIQYWIAEVVCVGVPDIVPVDTSKARPGDSEIPGSIVHVSISPPEVVGVKACIVWFERRFKESVDTTMTIGRSSDVSSVSQIPSPSVSVGWSNGSRSDVPPHSASCVAVQPSLSLSSSALLPIPSPSESVSSVSSVGNASSPSSTPSPSQSATNSQSVSSSMSRTPSPSSSLSRTSGILSPSVSSCTISWIVALSENPPAVDTVIV